MRTAKAFAKINLSLVVGPMRPEGKHEVVTVLQKIDLCDLVHLARATDEAIVVEGFDDTIVRAALSAFSVASGDARGFLVRIAKRIPVGAGLGGGSADAAAALRLANELTDRPLRREALREVASAVGADVPFFLERGAQLGQGDGSVLSPVEAPLAVWIVLVVPHHERKDSTADVYREFDDRGGATGFNGRREALLTTLSRVARPLDLASLPRNDLASSPLAGELERLGALRADVTGAGPAVYGIFDRKEDADRAAHTLRASGTVLLTRPVPDA